MKFNEDDNNDYFDGTYVPEEPPKPKEPKAPTFKPDDPRYWDDPEPEFEHLKPEGRSRIWWWLAAAGILVGLLIAGYIRWFTPYAENAVQYGYVEAIDYEGTLFKTYEGVMLPYKNIMDTTRVYQGDFLFSTLNDSAAVLLRRMQYANHPVRVEYKVYHSALPWRGKTKYVVVRADTVDPRLILPPDRQPKFE